ncbi:hypothetical protein GCM10025868_14630 [Angustibacter aerolatus]|uniref:Polysaccharide pyruvyl transferase domain-containing protein n=1 Tax=Angustibacter aerolatus TaxID=1162965 RepID=A0ABQ6JDF4_9ACTN|nr:hypothetical protein GCM10025868_14630 [Angustibacter aerolatus]
MHQAGVPLVLAPQTIGPFDTRQGRVIGRRSMRTAALVMARDSVSERVSRELGRPADVLTTDVVFAIPVPEIERTRDVVLNVSGLLWQDSPHVDASSYREVVMNLSRRLLADGRRITLLAHVLDSKVADNDVPAVHEVARLLEAEGHEVEVVVPTDLDGVRQTVGSAQVVIGSRMHACLNALSLGTPAVPLAYSRKFAPLLGDLGWPHTIDLRTHADPVAGVLEVLERTDLFDTAKQVVATAAETRALARQALQSVV